MDNCPIRPNKLIFNILFGNEFVFAFFPSQKTFQKNVPKIENCACLTSPADIVPHLPTFPQGERSLSIKAPERIHGMEAFFCSYACRFLVSEYLGAPIVRRKRHRASFLASLPRRYVLTGIAKPPCKILHGKAILPYPAAELSYLFLRVGFYPTLSYLILLYPTLSYLILLYPTFSFTP